MKVGRSGAKAQSVPLFLSLWWKQTAKVCKCVNYYFPNIKHLYESIFPLKGDIIWELFEVANWLETGFSQISSCKQKSASDKKLLYFIDAKEVSSLLGGSRFKSI